MHLLKRDPDDPGKLLLGHADLQPTSPDTGGDPPMDQLGEIALRFYHHDRPQRKDGENVVVGLALPTGPRRLGCRVG
jgi:hypothetical protein